jgi:hypothetical protein
MEDRTYRMLVDNLAVKPFKLAAWSLGHTAARTYSVTNDDCYYYYYYYYTNRD